MDLTAALDAKLDYSNASFVVIAALTNYDSVTYHFNSTAVEYVIELVMKVNLHAIMVIKSTVPVGYTISVWEEYNCKNIIFRPEFLGESEVLYDNLFLSRIIIGTDMENKRLTQAVHIFSKLLKEGAIKESIGTLLMGFTEAETVNLLVNTYLRKY